MQRSDILWIIAFVLGFVFSFAVLDVPPGIGLFLGVNILAGALIYFGRRNLEAKEIEPTKESQLLLDILTGFYIFLTIPYLYRLDYSIIVLLVFIHVGLFVLGALYFALPGALHLVNVFSFIFAPLVMAIGWVVESFKSVVALFKENANIVRLLLKIVLYAAASLFVFILFAKLLEAADPEFKVRIESILESLKLIEVMRRTVIAVIMSFVAAGLLVVVGQHKVLSMFGYTVEKAKEQMKKIFEVVMKRRSDALLPVIITAPVLFLFTLYVWVQFKYLFGQDVTAILAKYSFAEYAHRGIIDLLVVSGLTYPLLAWSMSQSKTEWKVPRIATFAVNTGIVSMLFIMLYSLIVRIGLYIQTYGPSVLRMYVVIGAIFVFIALLAYEILAIFKVMKPHFAVFRGNLFGDYTIIALLSALSLATAISIISWNNVVVQQIEKQYSQTKKVDIFQLTSMPLESEDEVYKFGQRLIEDSKGEAGVLLQAHATKEVAQYASRRKQSLFTNIFGFNLSGMALTRQVPVSRKAELENAFEIMMKETVSSIRERYINLLEQNDFTKARLFYDPQMKANNIAGFSPGVSIVRSASSTPNLFMNDMTNGETKTLMVSQEINIHRLSGAAKDTLQLTFGFRDGDVVLVDNTVILSYLPDAVTKDESSVTAYGYRHFCTIPNLHEIFSGEADCFVTDGRPVSKSGVTDYFGKGTMGNFMESDFVTKSK